MPTMQGERTHHLRRVLALLAIATLNRLVFLLLIPRALDNADAIHYAEAARRFAEGTFFAHDPKIPVLYPLLGGFATLFTQDPEWGCRLVSFVFSCLTLLPAYAIALRLHGPRTAWWSGIIVALWPWLADYAATAGTEALAVFLWLTGFCCLLQARRGACALCAAIAFGLLYLTRAEGMLIALAAFPAAALIVRPWPSALRFCGIHGAVLVAVATAAALYNRALTGAPNPNVRVGYIVAEFHLLRFATTALDTVMDVIPIMLGPVLMVFLGLGLFAPRPATPPARRPNEEAALLLLCAVQLVASWFVLSPAPRYLMAPLIALGFWSAAGLVLLQGWLSATHCPRIPPALLRALPALALIAFFSLGATRTLAGEYLSPRPRQPVEYREAGRWMRENLEPGLIFTRKPQVAFYANMPSTGPLDNDTFDEAMARAREAGARYLVVDERYAPPALQPLLHSPTPPGLTLLHRVDTPARARVAIFALTP